MLSTACTVCALAQAPASAPGKKACQEREGLRRGPHRLARQDRSHPCRAATGHRGLAALAHVCRYHRVRVGGDADDVGVAGEGRRPLGAEVVHHGGRAARPATSLHCRHRLHGPLGLSLGAAFSSGLECLGTNFLQLYVRPFSASVFPGSASALCAATSGGAGVAAHISSGFIYVNFGQSFAGDAIVFSGSAFA